MGFVTCAALWWRQFLKGTSEGRHQMENLFAGKWSEIKGEVMKAWSSISHEELELTGGSLQSVVTLLQDKFGMAREEAATRLMELAAAIEGDQAKHAPGETKSEPTKH
jgi:uncharacterized protein YjbJ (UPF0337 family)